MKSISALFVALCLSFSFFAKAENANVNHQQSFSNFEELDPFDQNVEQKLEQLDQDYQSQTGKSAFLFENILQPDCYRLSCSIYAVVDKSQQKLFLYINGQQTNEWLVSTGVEGRETPNLDTHPDGRIYDAYSSIQFPGGDYEGLGNMPYAVFIQGGFAIHGTPKGNWSKLGTRASHGCIRLHPDNAKIFNQLVRQYGIRDVWVTVQ